MTLNKSNPAFTPKSNSSIALLPYPYIGLVKNNTDSQNMGRLGVWIPELCGDPLDQGSWIICSYCSPFAGATNLNELENYQDPNTQIVSQQSYGWVGIPPDLNNEVMVVFACGDINKAYWVGCTYQQNMNHMVPGISVDTTYPNQQDIDGAPLPTIVPVMEYNKAGVTGSPNNVNRPVFQPLATGLMREGLLNDLERGAASTSMRREAPPLMSGWLSPRGNTIHIDDNAQDEFIRFRTRSGTQILIHETTGYIYMNSKNGNSWFEISDSGINGYTSGPLSMRAVGDINLIAGGNMNLDAANINMRATNQINMGAVTIQIGASGALTMSAGTNINSAAAGIWARSGSTIQDNAGIVPPATPPTSVTVSDTKAISPTGIWTYGATTLNSIASVIPMHEPWPGHPNANIPPFPTTIVPQPNVGGQGNGSNGGGTTYAPNAGSAPGSSGSSTPSNGAIAPSNPATNSCTFGIPNTAPISTVNFNAIQTASQQVSGLPANPFATLLAFANIESTFNSSAGPVSGPGAKGLFQFIDGTWDWIVSQAGAQYGVPTTSGAVFNPGYNALMGAAYMVSNMKVLSNNGLTPDAGNLYLLHFFGPGGGQLGTRAAGGITFLKTLATQPSGIAASLFPNQAAGAINHNNFYNRANNAPYTMQQVHDNLRTIINDKVTAYQTQVGLPAPCDRVKGNTTGVSNKINQSSPQAAVASAQGLTGRYWGRNEECVSLVQSPILNLQNTSTWTKGSSDLVANPPPPGTAIATFAPNGTYTNQYGLSHAAIYLGPADSGNGIKVLEQSNGHPAHINQYQVGNSPGYGAWVKGVEQDARNYSVVNYNN